MSLVTSLLLAGLGFLVGTIGTLIGAGGGFVLVPILLLLYPSLPPDVVTSISLGVVFLNSASGSAAYARMKRIDYKSALAFAIATLPGSVIGAFATEAIPRHTFDLILGVLLVLIGIFLFIRPQQGSLSYRTKGAGLTTRRLTDSEGNTYQYSFSLWTGIIISFFVGFLSSLLGIGGGIIHVPALTSLLNFPITVATATSHFVLAIMSLTSTVVHVLQGHFKGQWLTTLYIGIGVVFGAQLGAWLSHRIKPLWIIRTLAFALLLVGVRLLFN
jgi:uncharacterized protein